MIEYTWNKIVLPRTLRNILIQVINASETAINTYLSEWYISIGVAIDPHSLAVW